MKSVEVKLVISELSQVKQIQELLLEPLSHIIWSRSNTREISKNNIGGSSKSKFGGSNRSNADLKSKGSTGIISNSPLKA